MTTPTLWLWCLELCCTMSPFRSWPGYVFSIYRWDCEHCPGSFLLVSDLNKDPLLVALICVLWTFSILVSRSALRIVARCLLWLKKETNCLQVLSIDMQFGVTKIIKLDAVESHYETSMKHNLTVLSNISVLESLFDFYHPVQYKRTQQILKVYTSVTQANTEGEERCKNEMNEEIKINKSKRKSYVKHNFLVLWKYLGWLRCQILNMWVQCAHWNSRSAVFVVGINCWV